MHTGCCTLRHWIPWGCSPFPRTHQLHAAHVQRTSRTLEQCPASPTHPHVLPLVRAQAGQHWRSQVLLCCGATMWCGFRFSPIIMRSRLCARRLASTVSRASCSCSSTNVGGLNTSSRAFLLFLPCLHAHSHTTAFEPWPHQGAAAPGSSAICPNCEPCCACVHKDLSASEDCFWHCRSNAYAAGELERTCWAGIARNQGAHTQKCRCASGMPAQSRPSKQCATGHCSQSMAFMRLNLGQYNTQCGPQERAGRRG